FMRPTPAPRCAMGPACFIRCHQHRGYADTERRGGQRRYCEWLFGSYLCSVVSPARGAGMDHADWLSRLLEMIPVRGVLDLRCFLAAPWRIEYEQSPRGEIPYHAVASGSALLEAPAGTPPPKHDAGDHLLPAHPA